MIELLAPAGNMEKLKTAFNYGADSVYIGGEAFGLRANAANFTLEDIDAAVRLANSFGKRVYVTMNILARNSDLDEMKKYASALYEIGVHAVIVADIGAFCTIKEAVPINIHISTQANNLNYMTCQFWQKQGAGRVNVARELSLKEIKDIHDKLEANGCHMEIEAFVHGAMCMSYSGRCMLSDYMTGRSSNRGDCAQPCRWRYTMYAEEENRPGEFMKVCENDRGTFIFSSRDLCMIEHIREMIDAGITALKIEGRMKSEFYTAITVRAYRIARDYALAHEAIPGDVLVKLLDELNSVSHRQYAPGFYLGGKASSVSSSESYERGCDFIGTVKSIERNGDTYRVCITQRGTFARNDILEFVPFKGDIIKYTVEDMFNDGNELIDRAPHAMMNVFMNTFFEVPVGCVVRRRK